ncbi:DUF2384 domain-containing protein [Limimaricola sp. G21655-S1]|jgi:transcriptional regulator with XRE-family HTH domain|uniref:XRE family transcriptional regulator n=1 Tax=Limimaricola cinnabarinus TaxID=1125964 RepID=A0A2G1MC88_9RHOB|nr:antitoxin Xre/MbcA/ParS toxin-binding domain-containing protein [Limimaricola sp. G21655-S1]MCZ4262778.1 DUF2384 domain-containing protein [Limimaricola sp. G21655-S1]PHP26282.1 XRE family transcriptional regulator [Limimaricola cinnabarinus]
MAIASHPSPTSQDLTLSDGTVALDALLEALHLTRTELACVLGMSPGSLSTAQRLSSEVSQQRLRDLVEILVRVTPWAGSLSRAFAWFSTQPLPSFGGRTAADLVREGRAEAIRFYVSRIALSGYA